MVAEEVERVDLVEAVRAARQVDPADEGIGEVTRAAVRVVDEDDERLQEEERHDREVVAEQPPRREPEQKPDERRRDDRNRDRDLCLQVMTGMAAGHDPVEVGAEAEERDVTEVEQAGEPDDHIQTKREQRVDDRDQPVAVKVPLAREDRKDRERPEQDYEAPRGRHALPGPANETGEALLGFAALVDVRNPFVHADARPVASIGTLGNSRRHTALEVSTRQPAHTFWITGEPSKPLGRTRNIAIRSPNT